MFTELAQRCVQKQGSKQTSLPACQQFLFARRNSFSILGLRWRWYRRSDLLRHSREVRVSEQQKWMYTTMASSYLQSCSRKDCVQAS